VGLVCVGAQPNGEGKGEGEGLLNRSNKISWSRSAAIRRRRCDEKKRIYLKSRNFGEGGNRGGRSFFAGGEKKTAGEWAGAEEGTDKGGKHLNSLPPKD